MGKQESPSFYDDMFVEGGLNKMYHGHYSDYVTLMPIWTRSIAILKGVLSERETPRLLELGCGPGQFAHYIRDEMPECDYLGLDFSPVAIKMAQDRNQQWSDRFRVEDVQTVQQYGDYQAIYASEFIEHISHDLEVVNSIAPGTFVLVSCPSYDAPGHVRFFKEQEEVIQRYSPFLDEFSCETTMIFKGKLFDYNIHLFWGIRM